jgi:hypothetical protein
MMIVTIANADDKMIEALKKRFKIVSNGKS